MRLLVGTLYSSEHEFAECARSIGRQTHLDWEHVVFQGLPEQAAHEALYRTFMDRADEFDVMIKVDADMVIEDRELFAKICRKFEELRWMDQLVIDVHDFFSDQLIGGLSAFRNTVVWPGSQDKLFADSSPVPESKRLRDRTELAPAAIHCKDPSPLQAFHYGVHRGLKVVQAARRTKQPGASAWQLTNLERTWRHFLRRRDRRLGLAVLGAQLAFQGVFDVGHVNYNDPFPRRVFERYAECGVGQLRSEVLRLRLLNVRLLVRPWLGRVRELWYSKRKLLRAGLARACRAARIRDQREAGATKGAAREGQQSGCTAEGTRRTECAPRRFSKVGRSPRCGSHRH